MKNNNNNIITKIAISLLIIFSVSYANAQVDEGNYGKFDKDKEVSVSGTQLDQDGFQISTNKEQKKNLRKQKK